MAPALASALPSERSMLFFARSAERFERMYCMNLIPTRVHGVLDYIVGLLLIAAPFVFGFAYGGEETYVPVSLGIAALVYSLLTRYELGLIRIIPMPAHLVIDFCSGLLLAASPWLFGFADKVVWPHVVFGLLEMGVVVMSQRTPHLGDRHDHTHGGHVAHA
jgi:hypothetical protein